MCTCVLVCLCALVDRSVGWLVAFVLAIWWAVLQLYVARDIPRVNDGVLCDSSALVSVQTVPSVCV